MQEAGMSKISGMEFFKGEDSLFQIKGTTYTVFPNTLVRFVVYIFALLLLKYGGVVRR
jgi:hypothetical protein